MEEQNELCIDSKYQFETISKSLNRLSPTKLITDELLESIIEDELNIRINKGTDDLGENRKSGDELKYISKDELNEESKEITKDDLNDELKSESKDESNLIKIEQDVTDVDSDIQNRIDPSNFNCKVCGIKFSSRATLEAHQNYYCTKRKQVVDQKNSINETLRMLASGLLNLNNKQREKRAINGSSNEPNSKKCPTDQTIKKEMCNNTGRDQVMVSQNSQMSNDVSSDSDELEKLVNGQEEQINNSNNSSVSLSNLNSIQQNPQSIDNLISNNGIDTFNSSTNTARFLQTMNLLLSSSLASQNNQDEQTSNSNSELIETIQKLLSQSGNQNLANSILAAANQQRTNSFACKFCTFTTAKRQQLIKHVRTNCEGLLSAVANLNSNLQTSTAANNTSVTASITTSTTTNSTNNTTTTNCNSPTISNDQQSDDLNAAQILNSSATLNSTAEHLNAGCGNLACVNSNCTNGNSCVILSNAGNLLNSIGQPALTDDSEDDLINSTNPQDRFCLECEIQFASYKNYKVHKQFYCKSRHCSQKIQPSINLNLNSRKRTISDVNCPTSLLSSAVSISNLLAPNSSPQQQSGTQNNKTLSSSPQQNLFSNQSQTLTNFCKNSSLLNSTNASCTSEAGSPNLQPTTASIVGLNNSSDLPLSLSPSNMNAQQIALVNELFANGNIINLSSSMNIIQQLTQPVYIAVSTNPIILLQINSAGNSSLNNTQATSCSTNTTTTTTSSSTNKQLSSSSTDQDNSEQQLLNNQLDRLLSQSVLESLNRGNNDSLLNNLLNIQQSNKANSLINPLNSLNTTNNSQQRTGDEPIDLSASAKRRCNSTRMNNIYSFLEQQSIDALNELNSNQNPTDAQAALAAYFLPKLTSLKAQSQLLLNQPTPRIYSCNECQIEFHKQENYEIHKKYYCSATKQLLEQMNLQKQSPSPTDDLDPANHLSINNSGPNSPQSQQAITNRRSAASNSTTINNLVDVFNNHATKKSSTSSSVVLNANNTKTSGCVSPSISNSPIGSPSFINSNQLTNTSSISPAQPIYKYFCNKCGIRFTSKDNLHAHQTYYCMNNSKNCLNGTGISNSTITTFNSSTGQMEITCPKCRSCYYSEDIFLAHICPANLSASSQVTTANNCSSTSTSALTNVTPSVSGINTNASLIDALESFKQQALNPKSITASILNSAVSNSTGLLANNSGLNATSCSIKSNNNNQAFKCTICGYKGHTLRGMKTHVRVHGDQLQGAQEENFIIPLNDECCAGLSLVNNSVNLTPAIKRRRSTDPMQILSNFNLSNSANSMNNGLLLNNNLNPLLSNNNFMNGLMGNLMSSITNQLSNHLVSGLVSANLSNSSNDHLINDALSSTSEVEDPDNDVDNSQNQSNSPSNNLATTCNGTINLSSSNNSTNNIGKC